MDKKSFVENNENLEVCKNCGTCCKNYAGIYHPEDFEELSVEALSKIMDEGNLAIDWFENSDIKGFFLRPRHVGGGKIDPSWGAQCVYLTDNGCKLPFDKRPYGCKRLVPKERNDKHCKMSYEKDEAWEDWKPHFDILKELYKKYHDDYEVSGSPSPLIGLMQYFLNDD